MKKIIVCILTMVLSGSNLVFAQSVVKPVEKSAEKTVEKPKEKLIVAPAIKTINNVSKPFRVAVVDVQKVVNSSKQIMELKTKQQQKLVELQKFVDNAKAEVANESNSIKKKALEDGYNKELNERKNAMDKEFAQKLSSIEKSILEIIAIKARNLNYDLVLTKSETLYGGTDLTEEIIKSIK